MVSRTALCINSKNPWKGREEHQEEEQRGVAGGGTSSRRIFFVFNAQNASKEVQVN
jgi:hypothetical protein